MSKIIPYNPALKSLARKLRKEMTLGEILLWNDKIFGFDFDRQRCIDNYIVDFYCKELMLAIEVDGRYHEQEEVANKDLVREQTLKKFGITILRFSETEVKSDLLNVLRTIETHILNILKGRPEIKLPNNFDNRLLNN